MISIHSQLEEFMAKELHGKIPGEMEESMRVIELCSMTTYRCELVIQKRRYVDYCGDLIRRNPKLFRWDPPQMCFVPAFGEPGDQVLV